MRKNTTRLRFLALVIGGVAGLALAEAGLRLFDALRAPPPPIHERRAPETGAAIRHWPVPPTEGPRILVVGDSFTFGHGIAVDDTFPALLAGELAARDVTVISYSRPGWNTRRQHAFLLRDLEALDADVFVLALCLNDAEPRPTARMLAERPDLLPWRPQGRLEVFLARTSRVYSRLRRAADRVRLRPALRDYYLGLYRDPENLADWRRSLGRVRRLVAERSLPAVLVVFPIFDSDLDSEYAYRSLHRTVSEIGEEEGFRVLDLLPAYAGHAGRELALVPFTDPHPSALAHSLAAREIARFLAAEDLVPRGAATSARRPRADDDAPEPRSGLATGASGGRKVGDRTETP